MRKGFVKKNQIKERICDAIGFCVSTSIDNAYRMITYGCLTFLPTYVSIGVQAE